ncbi:MAG TPA: 2-oxoglutarate dehydrogenase E1 component, partial [Myxococcota bacterium]|nr:2-oxoglutarate dehydrogenase E1 component [Myxococcota bacterium]
LARGDYEAARDSMRAMLLIRAFRLRGHLEARLDPLGLVAIESHSDLDPRSYGFDDADLERAIYCDGHLGLDFATIPEIVSRARAIYCGTIGIEYLHILNPRERDWIMARMEGVSFRDSFALERRRAIFEALTAAEGFEQFLARKFVATKRFGLEGGEAAIPALLELLRCGARLGIEDVVLGMSHRGRLNVLANVLGKPLRAIIAEFKGVSLRADEIGGSGDVKYHLGTSSDREFDGKRVHVSLTPNPSHLEAVNPVVLGKVRAKQDLLRDRERKRCMGVLVHGDAAFAGQGLVSETLEFCDLEGYRTGGTIHLIINNQIGFTTSPVAARTGPYCSDVAKSNHVPIIHVNGDDPEAVVAAAELAVEYRQAFENDVVIDLFCYRRHGHNESDEPAFTQPLMYRQIAEHPTTRAIHAERLVADGVLTREQVDASRTRYFDYCEQEFAAADQVELDGADWLEGNWSGLEPVRGYDAHRGRTEVPLEMLREIGAALTRVPADFAIHPKLARQLDVKRRMFESGEGIDWATAEALAFGSLLIQGHPVRLSGEDCVRGTFSQRHAAWIDQQSEQRYLPLNRIRAAQERLEVIDSPLSEYGVLGFEYGYAMARPTALVLWEAQFGDFANGAQVVIDQFISAGESKWLRMSGLVLLLPHGFEGQGPEHSSARLERFLQCCAEDNIQVVNCTTPANYFHALRRQLHRSFRKPLIVMAPKSLLRHKAAVSPLAAMAQGTHFHRVLHCDALPSEPEQARQLVLCSGKLYYDLLEERERRAIRDVHLLRIEQLYPFPSDALMDEMQRYRHCHLVWCQEEPRNMGAWAFVSELIEEIATEMGFGNPVVRYAGRPTAASPATGFIDRHEREQRALIDEALSVGLTAVGRIGSRKAIARTASGERAPARRG